MSRPWQLCIQADKYLDRHKSGPRGQDTYLENAVSRAVPHFRYSNLSRRSKKGMQSKPRVSPATRLSISTVDGLSPRRTSKQGTETSERVNIYILRALGCPDDIRYCARPKYCLLKHRRRSSVCYCVGRMGRNTFKRAVMGIVNVQQFRFLQQHQTPVMALIASRTGRERTREPRP